MLTALALLTGCQSNDKKASETKHPAAEQEKVVKTVSASTFPYPNLLALEAQSYSLLVINATDEQAPIEQNQHITEHVKSILSLPTAEMVQKAYPKLELNNDTSYILFDQNGIVHQSTNI